MCSTLEASELVPSLTPALGLTLCDPPPPTDILNQPRYHLVSFVFMGMNRRLQKWGEWLKSLLEAKGRRNGCRVSEG